MSNTMKILKQRIKAHRGTMIDADSSIDWHHDPSDVLNNGNRLDLCQASALKEFGLVDHSVWVERH